MFVGSLLLRHHPWDLLGISKACYEHAKDGDCPPRHAIYVVELLESCGKGHCIVQKLKRTHRFQYLSGKNIFEVRLIVRS